MNDNDRRFIGYAVTECAKKGIKVVFAPKKFVYSDGTKCSGYFDEEDKELFVATKKPQRDWLSIFVHEFCHFQQWVEEDPDYMNLCQDGKLDIAMWDWLSGKDIPMATVKKSLRAYQKMELNCEKRAVQHIDTFGLSIRKSEYIQLANIYVLFYTILYKTRKWYKTPPYKVKKIMPIVPDTFLKSYTKVPAKFEKLVMENCF